MSRHRQAPHDAGLMLAHPVIEDVLDRWKDALAGDLAAYRGHVYRVFNYCRALSRDGDGRDAKVAVAAACHDLGIWSARTFDYLEPSAEVADDYLRARGWSGWQDEVRHMIVLHHKLLPDHGAHGGLVEAFRRADLVDLSWGAVAYGLPRPLIREVRRRCPNAGFHRRLVQIGGRWLLRHPLRPLPMVRL